MKCGKCGMEYPHNSMTKVYRDIRIEAEPGIFTTRKESVLLCSGCSGWIKNGQISFNSKVYYIA